MTLDGAQAVNPPLRSSRLNLEPLERRHAAAFFEGMRDAVMFTYCAGPPPASVAAVADRLMRWESRSSPDGSAKWLNWIARIHGGSYVGWFQATVTDGSAVIGYDVFVPFQRRGFGREGAALVVDYLRTSLGLGQIDAVVDTENAASIRLLESLGFARTLERASEDMPGRRDYLYRLMGPAF